MKSGSKISPDRYTSLSIRIDRYDVTSTASLNIKLMGSNPGLDDQGDPVFTADTWLTVFGTCAHPPERAGQLYEVKIAGEDHAGPPLRLRDIQPRDSDGFLAYKVRRGVQIPIYEPPLGMGVLDRRRTGEWTFLHQTDWRLVSDWLVLLANRANLFLALDEVLIDRKRWVRSISLQTTDPSSG